MKTQALLIFCVALGGCATGAIVPVAVQRPIPLIQKAPPPDSFSREQAESDLKLSSPEGSLTARASLLDHIVYVHTRFENKSSKPIAFGPEQLTLADSGNKLLRSAGLEEVVAPFFERTAALQNKAQQAAIAARQSHQDERLNDRNLRNSGAYESDNNTVRTLAATGDLSMLIGNIAQDSMAAHLQSQADASQAESAAVAQRVQSSLLQSRIVPPGTISEGWVYFAAPDVWPATLRAQINEQILSVSLVQRQ